MTPQMFDDIFSQLAKLGRLKDAASHLVCEVKESDAIDEGSCWEVVKACGSVEDLLVAMETDKAATQWQPHIYLGGKARAEMPCWVYCLDGQGHMVVRGLCPKAGDVMPARWTHWMPAKPSVQYDVPPAPPDSL